MKMKFAAIALASAIATAPAHAAFMNTEQLQSICEAGLADPTPQNHHYALCAGFMMGILAADAVEQHVICLPSGMDTKTALKIFVTRAVNEKDKSVEGLATMFLTFSEKFPCAK